MLLWVTFGWTLYRSDYTFEEKKYLFIFAILMTIPPLVWGLTQVLILFTNKDLQLHSVGHVNHSAIYLCIITSVAFSLLINQLKRARQKYIFTTSLLLILFIYCVILSQSRAAFGITILLISFMILLSSLTKRLKALLLTVVGVLLVCIIFVRPVKVIEKQILSQHTC